jgi:hypothetical protein
MDASEGGRSMEQGERDIHIFFLKYMPALFQFSSSNNNNNNNNYYY